MVDHAIEVPDWVLEVRDEYHQAYESEVFVALLRAGEHAPEVQRVLALRALRSGQ